MSELHCPILQCTSVHCTVLHCSTLSCTAVHSPALQYTVLHCCTLSCTAVHCPALQCTVLDCNTLSCTAVHCPALNFFLLPALYSVLFNALLCQSNYKVWQARLENFLLLQKALTRHFVIICVREKYYKHIVKYQSSYISKYPEIIVFIFI